MSTLNMLPKTIIFLLFKISPSGLCTKNNSNHFDMLSSNEQSSIEGHYMVKR